MKHERSGCEQGDAEQGGRAHKNTILDHDEASSGTADFSHERNVVWDPYGMITANVLDRGVVERWISSAQNIRLTKNSRLENGIVIGIAEDGWERLRQFH